MKMYLVILILFTQLSHALDCQSIHFIVTTDLQISNCLATEQVTQKLETIIEKMQNELEFPKSKIKLNLNQRSDIAFFDGELNLPHIYERVPGFAKNGAAAIWLHELGHIYFDTQYGKHNPKYKKIVESKQPSPINRAVLPYNELFADTFAVMWLKNPRAMFEVLIEAGQPIEWDISVQDFLNSYQGRNFSDLNNELNMWAQSNDAYDLFAPVRFHIGQKYDITSPKTDPQIILIQIYKAIESEVDKAAINPHANDYRQMNERLIKKI